MEKALSNFPQFDANDDFVIFKERFENQLEVYGIDSNARSGILISSLSANVYKVLKSLCDPELPKNKGYDDLIRLLQTLFTIKISVFKERKTFYDARQHRNETPNNWFLRVKNLSVNCAFGDELAFCLKDRFVCGLLNGSVFDEIAELEQSTNLDDLLKLAVSRDDFMRQNQQAMPQPLPGSKAPRKKPPRQYRPENVATGAAVNSNFDANFVEEAVKHVLQDIEAKKQSVPKPKGPKPPRPTGSVPKHFHQSNESLPGAKQFNEPRPPNGRPSYEPKVCWHCGRANHDSISCRFKNFTCVNCEQVGHVVTMCKHPIRK